MNSEGKRRKILVAGFNKTGTKSLAAALESLGYRVYDAKETWSIMHDDWCDIFQGRKTIEEIAKIYESHNVDVLVDIPGSSFWRQFKQIWPDALVILTIRDNTDIWYKSFKDFFEGLYRWRLYRWGRFFLWFSPTGIRSHRHLILPSFQFQFGTVKPHTASYDMDNPCVKHIITSRYEAHNAHVKEFCPPSDLLVMNVKEGWSPLCKFLQIDPIVGPLPHVNKSGGGNETKEFVAEMMGDFTKRCKKEIAISILLILLVPVIITVLLKSFSS